MMANHLPQGDLETKCQGLVAERRRDFCEFKGGKKCYGISVLQYHLTTDASITALGGCLFQLHDTAPGTEAILKFLPNERINFFMSYCLQDAETRYSNSERECYAIVRSLAEIR